MILRPHQEHALNVLRVSHRGTGSAVLVQQPCGTGKTEIGVRAVSAWIERPGVHRAVIAAPTIETVAQWLRRLRQVTRLPVGHNLPRSQLQPAPRAIVTTYAALWERLADVPPDALLVFDEAHHGNQEAPANLALIKRHPHVVGLSATPWTDGCRAVFGGTAHVVLPLSVAVRQGFVSAYAVEPWCEPAGPFGLVYVNGNRAARELAGRLGPRASWVGVHEPDSRARIELWRRGQLQVLVADRMLSEGFDAPRCDRVWLGRDSESPVLLVQCAGRALRPRTGKRARIHCGADATAAALRAALERCDSPRLTLV